MTRSPIFRTEWLIAIIGCVLFAVAGFRVWVG